MAKCTDCLHYVACSGFTPSELEDDELYYCKMGIPEQIPDIEQRCSNFESRTSWKKVVRCKDCIYFHKKLGIGFGQCSKTSLFPYDEDFCSYGERRSDGNL